MVIILSFMIYFLVSLNLYAFERTPLDVAALRQDIADSNASPDDDIINLSNGPFVLPDVYDGLNGLPIIDQAQSKTLTLRNGTIERGDVVDLFRFLEITQGSQLILENVTFRNGLLGPMDSGGAILVNGIMPLITGCTFSANTGVRGGAIAINASGTVGSIINSHFDTGSAGLQGGAIAVFGSLSALRLSTFTGNKAGDGGAIYIHIGGELTLIADSVFVNNAVSSAGGALFVVGHVAAIQRSAFFSNTALSGGALNISDANNPIPGLVDRIEDSLFVGNIGRSQGGAIMGISPKNTRPTAIGAISNSRFSDNSSSLGGVIFLQGSGITSIDGSTFSANSAQSAGGVIFAGSSKIGRIHNSTFDNNKVMGSFGDGGAILLAAESLLPPDIIPSTIDSIDNSTFSANNTPRNGGAIAFQSEGGVDTVVISTFSNNTVADNTAGGLGGGLYVPYQNSIQNFVSTIVAQNSAPDGPDVSDSAGAIVSEGFNLIGNNSGSDFIAGRPNSNQSFVGTPDDPIDSMLAPLADNGGDSETRALLPASLAINHGANPLHLVFDQRGLGFARTSGFKTDIGAFEVQEDCPDCKDCKDCEACEECDHDCHNKFADGKRSSSLSLFPRALPVSVIPVMPLPVPAPSPVSSATLIAPPTDHAAVSIQAAEPPIVEASACANLRREQGKADLLLLFSALLLGLRALIVRKRRA